MIKKKKICIAGVVGTIILVCMLVGIRIYQNRATAINLNFTDNIAFYINRKESVSLVEYLVYAASITQSCEADYGTQVWNENVALDNGSDIDFEEYTRRQIIEQIRLTKVLCKVADDYKLYLTEKEKREISSDAQKYLDSLTKYKRGKAGIDLLTIINVYKENALAEKVYTKISGSAKRPKGMGNTKYSEAKIKHFKKEYKKICKRLSPDWDYKTYSNIKVLSSISFVKNSEKEKISAEGLED